MAKKSAGFVDEHIEKVVLGGCGFFLLVCIYLAFGSGRFEIEGKGPSTIAQATGEAANSTASRIVTKQPDQKKSDGTGPTPKPGQQDPVAVLRDWFGDQAKGLIAIAQLASPVARTQPFPPKLVSTSVIAPEDRHNLAALVPPGLPVVTNGRSTFEFPANKPTLNEYDGIETKEKLPASPRNWVAVAAQVDLIQQDINFKTEKYPDGSYLGIVAVHLERFDQSESWRGWQPVQTYLPFKPFERPGESASSISSVKPEVVSEFKDLIDRKQEAIARPKMNSRSGGDKFAYPPVPYFPDPPGQEGDTTTRVKRWLSLASKAVDGKTPFASTDLDAAVVLLRAVIGTANVGDRELRKAESTLASVVKKLKGARKSFVLDQAVRPPEKLMPIVAYDMDVVPGHTYTYRMRYEVFNIFAGNAGELLDPADAEKLTIASGWSPPSRPVTIESDTYFYLTKADDKKNEVTVTVYKKRGKEAAKEATFKVAVGDEIGGERKKGNSRTDFTTGAVCLDIHFNRKVNGKADVTLIYVDTHDGSVREKYLSIDRNDKFRKSLTSEKTAAR